MLAIDDFLLKKYKKRASSNKVIDVVYVSQTAWFFFVFQQVLITNEVDHKSFDFDFLFVFKAFIKYHSINLGQEINSKWRITKLYDISFLGEIL